MRLSTFFQFVPSFLAFGVLPVLGSSSDGSNWVSTPGELAETDKIAARETHAIFGRDDSRMSVSQPNGILSQVTQGLAAPDDSYWLGQIPHPGASAFNDDPTYKVYRNVKDYGAKGDGVTDDTDVRRALFYLHDDADGYAICYKGHPTSHHRLG